MAGQAMLNQLYDASYGRLVVQLFAFCGDLDLAEQAVQEAFVSAIRRHRELNEVHDQESWVRTVALERIRSWRLHERSVRRPRVAVPGSEHAVELDEDQAEAMAALAALDDEQREVVVLEQLGGVVLAPSGGGPGVAGLDRLRDIGAWVQPPAFSTLVRVAHRRRAQVYILTLGGVLVALLLGVVVTLVAGLDEDDRSLPGPPDHPSPSPSVRDSWTPERIRGDQKAYGSEPTLADVRDGDVAARVWIVCTARCSSWDRAVEGGVLNYLARYRLRWTVEVTGDGFRTSTLVPEFGLPGRVSFWRDDLFVVSQQEGASQSHHVVSADGQVVDLTLVDTAEPRPQPGITVLDGRLVVIDLEAGTFADVAVPFIADHVQWAPNPTTWLWGVSATSNQAGDVQTSDAVWQEPQGYFRQHRLAQGPVILDVEPVDEIGTMAFTERNWDTGRLAVHLSKDRGRTWQRIEVSSRREIRRLLE